MESNVIVPKSSTAAAMLAKVNPGQSKGDEVAMVPFDQLLQQASKTAGKNTDRTGDEGELGGVVDRVNARKGEDGAAPRDDADDGSDDWTRDHPADRTEDWRDDWSARSRDVPAAHSDDRPPAAGDGQSHDPEVAPTAETAADPGGTQTNPEGRGDAGTAEAAAASTAAGNAANGGEAARNPAVAGAVAATKAAEPAQRNAAPNSAVAQGTAPGTAKAKTAANPNTAQAQTSEAGTQNDAATVAAPAKKAASATAQTARTPTAGQQAPAAAQAGQQRQQGDNAAARQASDLSNRLGGKTNAQVAVTVEDEGAVASQPRTTIAAPTVAGAGTAKPAAAGQGRNARTAAAGQANGANQQAAAQAAAQAPAQVQAPAPTATAGAAKAAGPTAVQSVSGGSAASGGGEALGTGNTGTTGEARQAQHTAAAQNQKAAAGQRPPVAEQVSVHIAKAVRAGVDRIHIQLKPASMGRVDVQMEIAKDGRVSAVVTVDNRETLNALQKDSHTLEQALRDAGLQAESDDLQFSLRGEQGGEGGDANPGGRLAEGEGGGETAAGAEAEGDTDAAERAALLLARARGLANRIDIRA